MPKRITFYAYVWLLFAIPSVAGEKNETGSDYLEAISKNVLELTKESERLSQDFNNRKYRVIVYGFGLGAVFFVLPYSLLWTIDNYFPEAIGLKQSIYYNFTPCSLLMGAIAIYHSFKQAGTNITVAEGSLNEALKFFRNLAEVCKYLKDFSASYKGDDIIQVAEKYLHKLRKDQTPVGDYLLSIFQRLQMVQAIDFYVVKTDEPIFCEIFSTLIETINGTKLGRIRHNEVLLHFNGFRLSSCDYLNLEELREYVVDNYKAAGFGNGNGRAFPFLNAK